MIRQTFKISDRRLADIRLAAGIKVLLAIVFMVASWDVARPGRIWPAASLGFGALAAILAALRSARIYSSARKGELDILIDSESVRVSRRLTLRKVELARLTGKRLRRGAPGTIFLEVLKPSSWGSRTVRIDARAYEGGKDLMPALTEWASVAK